MKQRRLVKLVLAPAALVALPVLFINSTAVSKPEASGVATATGGGAALFGAKCVICHGKDGAGLPNWRAKGQPDLTNPEWQRSHTDSQIADTIRNGRGKFMPAFKTKLSDDEVAALVGRVRELGKK